MKAEAMDSENQYQSPNPERSDRIVDSSATPDERNYCMLMHLSLLLHIVLPGLAIIATLIMWQTRRASSPFIDDHGREAMNFSLSMIVYNVAVWIIALLTCVGSILAIPISLGLTVLGIVGMVLATVAASRSEYFRYPMCLRFLSE